MGEGAGTHLNACLDAGYWIARYPVTVGQFEAFAHAAGYALRAAWKPYSRLPNHPSVVVTWHDVSAFCAWLTATWRAAGILGAGWSVRLPSEAEWEKAARGGLQVPVSPLVARAQDRPWAGIAPPELVDNPFPRRRYPWGNDLSPDKANYRATGLGTTSAVGCFPGGASPYGVEDLSGNVWEWTRSLWGRDVSEPQYPYPYDPADGREDQDAGSSVFRVLCGGAFSARPGNIRCAARNRDLPNYGYGNLGFRVVVIPV
jgi:formylglycine-generating enzyme required for sulfatase activity